MRFLLFATFLLMLLWSLTATAADHNKAQALVKSGAILPLESILTSLAKIVDGQVIEVELEQKKIAQQSYLVYEIEIVNKQGIVTEYYFDAKTGKLLKQKVED